MIEEQDLDILKNNNNPPIGGFFICLIILIIYHHIYNDGIMGKIRHRNN